MKEDILKQKLAFEKKLIESFPVLYRGEDWKRSGGVSCGPGWNKLIWDLSENLEAIANSQQPPPKHNIIKRFLYRCVTKVKQYIDNINFNMRSYKIYNKSPAGMELIKLKHKLAKYKPEVVNTVVNKLLVYLSPPHDSRISVIQVKEKFGGLRFYLSSSSGDADKFVSEAERKSFTICENCGGEGKQQNSHGWYITMCDIHFAEHLATREKYLENLKSVSVDK